jgi:hypothetical protein
MKSLKTLRNRSITVADPGSLLQKEWPVIHEQLQMLQDEGLVHMEQQDTLESASVQECKWRDSQTP